MAHPRAPVPSRNPLNDPRVHPRRAPERGAFPVSRGGPGAVPGRLPPPPRELLRARGGGSGGGAAMAEGTVQCRVQYLEDADPFGCGSFPEPRRAPVYAVEEALALGAQLPALHRLLGAPLPVKRGGAGRAGRAGRGVPCGEGLQEPC